jgi:hypothetical protein
MTRFISKTLALILTAAFLTLPLGSVALAEEYFETETPGGGEMMWDLVACRPAGIVATVLGTAVWLVSYPFSALGGNTDQATEELVKKPARFTFQRPLGDF